VKLITAALTTSNIHHYKVRVYLLSDETIHARVTIACHCN